MEEDAYTTYVVPAVDEVGVNAELAPDGIPLLVKATFPVNPLTGVTVTANVPPAPGASVKVGEAVASAKVGVNTVKLCETGVAAAYSELPGCDAVIVQVPGASVETLPPETPHTDGVAELYVAGRSELAVADNVTLAPTIWLPIGGKVIVCVAGITSVRVVEAADVPSTPLMMMGYVPGVALGLTYITRLVAPEVGLEG